MKSVFLSLALIIVAFMALETFLIQTTERLIYKIMNWLEKKER